jgi:hypothetical protein
VHAYPEEMLYVKWSTIEGDELGDGLENGIKVGAKLLLVEAKDQVEEGEEISLFQRLQKVFLVGRNGVTQKFKIHILPSNEGRFLFLR